MIFFIDSLYQNPIDENILKNYGLRNKDVIHVLKRIFINSWLGVNSRLYNRNNRNRRIVYDL